MPGAQDPIVGKTLVGKYTVVGVLGSGAMGTIYKAEQTALGKVVVIKVLHRHLLTDPELIQRFHREARAASRLNHPNCVQIMDFGTLDDGSLYIAMEYIQGIDLATLLERDFPIDHRRLISIVKQVCQALDEAHANGVLHRDLKPENIMIEDRRTARDFVKVVDFGIAKLEENNPNARRSFQTRTGIVCGTPEYMSPEQARGLKLDARSDLYAVGVMLYHLTTDHLPFEADSPIEVVTKHISEPPAPPSTWRADVPEALEQLILTLLEKDREKRPASALDVQAELERIDRELAAERREKIEVKNTDDATMVDMRPISALVAAIDLVPKVAVADSRRAPAAAAQSFSENSTDETTREEIDRAAGRGSSELSLSDTIPENVGREMSERLAKQDLAAPAKKSGGLVTKGKGESQPKVKERKSGDAAQVVETGRSSGLTPVRRDKAAVAPTSAAWDARGRGEEGDEAPPKKRLWLWLLLGGLVVAAGATVAVVISI